LGHDQLDILVLKTRSIDFLSVVLIVVLLVIASVNSLALAVVAVIVTRVVMSSVVVRFSSSKLLGSGSLSLGVQILDLGLAENAAQLSVNLLAQR